MVQFKMKNQGKVQKKKVFFVLWIFCVLGAWSVLPYLLNLGMIPPSTCLSTVFLVTTAQAMLFFAIVCWLSYLLIPRTDLAPFSADQPLKRIVLSGVIAGLLVGIVIYLLDLTLFKSSQLTGVHPPAWTGALASFYGAINEEVLMRLFFFTAVYILLRKVFSFKLNNRMIFLWVSNVIVAIFFGLGHLPAAFKLGVVSSTEVIRVLLLNGLPGIVFGWLYWSKGLWTAIAAHFVADLLLHVFLI